MVADASPRSSSITRATRVPAARLRVPVHAGLQLQLRRARGGAGARTSIRATATRATTTSSASRKRSSTSICATSPSATTSTVVRVGIQPFSSDFRGFLFQDNQLGVRLFGTRDNNRWQYNLAWFRRLEKDTNSGLNDLGAAPAQRRRVRRQPLPAGFPVLGFTSQATVIYNRNREGDEAVLRQERLPRAAGGARRRAPRDYDVAYFGYNGDGHFGRWNLTGVGLLRGRRRDARPVRRSEHSRHPRVLRRGGAVDATSTGSALRLSAAVCQRRQRSVRRHAPPASTRSSRTRSSPAPTPATGSARRCR